jgi:hypothetical protein
MTLAVVALTAAQVAAQAVMILVAEPVVARAVAAQATTIILTAAIPTGLARITPLQDAARARLSS